MERETTPSRPSAETLYELAEELARRAELRPERCVDLSELIEFVQELDLAEDDAQALQDMLEERGLDVRDDCGRQAVEETAYVNDQLADRTTDAMSLFLQE